MALRISGILYDPFSAPAAGASIRFTAESTSAQILDCYTATGVTDEEGAYTLDIREGTYTIETMQSAATKWCTLAKGVVIDESVTSADLNLLILESDPDGPGTPSLSAQIDAIAQVADDAAQLAAEASDAAAQSMASADASAANAAAAESSASDAQGLASDAEASAAAAASSSSEAADSAAAAASNSSEAAESASRASANAAAATVRNFPRTPRGEGRLFTSLGGLNLNMSAPRSIPRTKSGPNGFCVVFGSTFRELSSPSDDQYVKARSIPRSEVEMPSVSLVLGDSYITLDAGDIPAEEPGVSPFFARYTPSAVSVYYTRGEAGESQVFAVDQSGETQITSAGSEWQFCTSSASGIPRVINLSGTPTPYSITANGEEVAEGVSVLHKLITGQSLALGSRGFVLSDDGSHEIEAGVYGDVFTQSLPSSIGNRCLTLEGGPRPATPGGSTVFEPMREYAGSNPLLGETIASGWAVGIDAWAQSETGMNARFLASVSAFGAQPYENLKKGTATYNNAISQIQNANDIASADGQYHFVPSISIVHGESQPDTSAADYAAMLLEWRDDYNTDILAITGQSSPVVAFVSQTNTGDNGTTYNAIPEIPKGQMIAHESSPNIIVTGPKYQYPYYDAYHMLAEGYVKAGEVEAKAESFHHMGQKWQPLKAASITYSGSVITVQTNTDVGGNIHTAGPVGPLSVDTDSVTNPGDYGFEIDGKTITAVELSSDKTAIHITVSEGAASGDIVRYAMQPPGSNQPSNGRRGNIRDNDSRTTSRFDGLPVYNWLVAFETTIA